MIKLNIKNNLLKLCAGLISLLILATGCRTVPVSNNNQISAMSSGSSMENPSSGGNNTTYMRFTIPLDTTGLYGSRDFEIKIEETTDTNTDAFNMVYYWQSMGDPWDGNNLTYGDTDARCYFIDSHQASAPLSLEIRKHQLYTNLTVSVTDSSSMSDRANHADSVYETVLFYPSHDGCHNDWTTWQLYANSDNLRASWIRYDDIGPETNSVGDAVWHPIEIEWITERRNETP